MSYSAVSHFKDGHVAAMLFGGRGAGSGWFTADFVRKQMDPKSVLLYPPEKRGRKKKKTRVGDLVISFPATEELCVYSEDALMKMHANGVFKLGGNSADLNKARTMAKKAATHAIQAAAIADVLFRTCLLYTSPSPRD